MLCCLLLIAHSSIKLSKLGITEGPTLAICGHRTAALWVRCRASNFEATKYGWLSIKITSLSEEKCERGLVKFLYLSLLCRHAAALTY